VSAPLRLIECKDTVEELAPRLGDRPIAARCDAYQLTTEVIGLIQKGTRNSNYLDIVVHNAAVRDLHDPNA